jgi:Fe-S-cluster containining protein
LCCNGTLFPRLAVTIDERELLREKGVFFQKEPGELRMRLPCNYLGQEGQCTCYEVRPDVCRKYRCDLLKSVDAGITPMTQAVEIVREAKALCDKAREACNRAIVAGGGTQPDAKEEIDELMDRIELMVKMNAPIPEPLLALAKYRYRCHLDFIRMYLVRHHYSGMKFPYESGR